MYIILQKGYSKKSTIKMKIVENFLINLQSENKLK